MYLKHAIHKTKMQYKNKAYHNRCRPYLSSLIEQQKFLLLYSNVFSLVKIKVEKFKCVRFIPPDTATMVTPVPDRYAIAPRYKYIRTKVSHGFKNVRSQMPQNVQIISGPPIFSRTKSTNKELMMALNMKKTTGL